MVAQARLRNYPTSPFKMRLLADLIRGKMVDEAVRILDFQPQHSSIPLKKTILSAVSNWKNKNSENADDIDKLVIKTIYVDGGRVLKRMRPAPQGRAYRIRKRSHHILVVVDILQENGLKKNSNDSDAKGVQEVSSKVENTNNVNASKDKVEAPKNNETK